MSPILSSYASLLGRILVSIIFLLSGFSKVTHWSDISAMMAQHGMPAVPLLLGAAALVEILGGLALLAGFQTRIVSLVLFLYLIPTTWIFHNFWAVSGPQQQEQMINFLKNLAIMGGLLQFFAAGAGALSVDARLSQRTWASAVWARVRRPV
jgi:putative oxidoreductase